MFREIKRSEKINEAILEYDRKKNEAFKEIKPKTGADLIIAKQRMMQFWNDNLIVDHD